MFSIDLSRRLFIAHVRQRKQVQTKVGNCFISLTLDTRRECDGKSTILLLMLAIFMSTTVAF